MQRRRGLVISNCQAAPLAQMLGYFCRDIAFTAFPVHLTNPVNRAAKIAELMAGAGAEADVVLTVPLSDDFGPLSAPRIAQTFAGRTVLRILNLFFSGLHPDLTYLGGMGGRITGPMGDYHSRVVAMAVTCGLSPAATLDLLTADTYRALDYAAEFDRSLGELRNREAEVDIPFADRLVTLIRRERGFLTVNHPTAALFGAYAHAIAHRLEALGMAQTTGLPPDPACLPNPLATNVVFPIYPEIAAAHGLPYADPYLFRTAPQHGISDVLTAAEFVAANHAALARLDPERLARSPHLRGHLDAFKALA
ncbi:MAG: WcbI family polysaccharide biosynthesis putative acetyltransferase [Gemmobacter sp.]